MVLSIKICVGAYRMLKKIDLKKVSSYIRWDGFTNLNYFSGWADNITEVNGRYEFDLRQTAYENQKLKVRLDKDEYLPSFFKEHKNPPIKIIGRIQQDPEKDYPTLIIRPIYLSKPSLIEMPSPRKFFSIGTHGEEYKTFNPFLGFDDYLKMSFNQQQNATAKCANKSSIAGILKSKKKISNDTVAIEVFNAENRIIPARLYGKLASQFYSHLEYLQPLLIEGALHSREDKQLSRIETFVKIENLNNVLVPGKHIPNKVPEWYINLQKAYEDGDAIQTSSITDTEPLINIEENTINDDFGSLSELKFDPVTGEPILNT